jgi:hypothetical protein
MIDSDILRLAEETVGSMPTTVVPPSKYASDRKAAAVQQAIWMSRAVLFANALLAAQRRPGDLEYQSWA